MNASKNWQVIFQYSIAGLIVFGFITLLIIMLFRLAPEGNQTLLNVLVGAFAGMTLTVVNYFFSSTKSSADKNEMLFKSNPTEEKK